MNWKLKALAQNVIAALPLGMSYRLYYYVQLRWGALRNPDPLHGLRVGADTWKHLLEIGFNPKDKVFFEVGTGRTPMAPLAFWLMGARSVITCDLNPYLSEDLTLRALSHAAGNPQCVRSILGDFLVEDRLRALVGYVGAREPGLPDLKNLFGIDYRAPFDAQSTRLEDSSVDVHTSYTVFEHIPGPVILGILTEARRILRPNGIALHLIDYSDHFSHDDPNLHWMNFLKYSDATWRMIAGNRFMYMNRLRHDDQLAIGRNAGLLVETIGEQRDPNAESGVADASIALARRFRSKPSDIMAIQSAWVAYRRN
jgi:SAM-dependent methyltransferase